ncbi:MULTISPECIES: hypothetical protein [Vibrio harveyi group]|uniref:hypothetical protein n=1 Tax=Vibrio harveyi group TaxID=717610 RepID=UPI000CE31B86|nr:MULTISPECIES: hypothetical protein [Vibrio harveyi group]HDM8062570.1 hypothetical protein [Vibrio harveyi]
MKLTQVGRTQPLCVSDSAEVLKSKGFKLAEELGVENPIWHSNVVMGDNRLVPNIREYRLYQGDKLLFKIEE